MIEATREIEVGDDTAHYDIKLGETVKVGSWYVTRVTSGWIYTLKNLPAAMAYSVADFHSVFVPYD